MRALSVLAPAVVLLACPLEAAEDGTNQKPARKPRKK